MENEILDYSILKEYYEGDEDLILAARDTFIDNWERLYSDITTAASTGELEALGNAAHALKGSCGVFWPRELPPLLEKIEDIDASERLAFYNAESERLKQLLEKLVAELKVMTAADLGA